MDKDNLKIICIDTKGGDGFTDEINGNEETLTVEELIKHLKDISNEDYSKKVYLTNDSTYRCINSSDLSVLLK